jgi:hypothetical protein
LKANVAKLHQVRGELKRRRPRVEIRHVIFPNERKEDLRQFRQTWLEFADAVKFNYLIPLSPEPRGVSVPTFKRCRHIRRELYVGPEGWVPLCGYRSQSGSDEVLGDLHHTTIRKLWQHPRVREVRACHELGDLNEEPFCKTCTQITA